MEYSVYVWVIIFIHPSLPLSRQRTIQKYRHPTHPWSRCTSSSCRLNPNLVSLFLFSFSFFLPPLLLPSFLCLSFTCVMFFCITHICSWSGDRIVCLVPLALESLTLSSSGCSCCLLCLVLQASPPSVPYQTVLLSPRFSGHFPLSIVTHHLVLPGERSKAVGKAFGPPSPPRLQALSSREHPAPSNTVLI